MTKDKSSQRSQKKQDNQRLGRIIQPLGDSPALSQTPAQTDMAGQPDAASMRAALRCQAAKSGRYQLNGLFRAHGNPDGVLIKLS